MFTKSDKKMKHLLFPFYFLMRFIKAPLFNAVIKPYYKWIKDPQAIKLDRNYFITVLFIAINFYFFVWYIAFVTIFISFIIKLAIYGAPDENI